MKPIYYVQCLLLVTLLTNTQAKSQNIINDTIVVSTGEAVTVKFPSDANGNMPDGDGSYSVSGLKKALLIKAGKANASSQLLLVTEGDRQHEFVLTYADKAPTLTIDFSSKKKLTVRANEKKEQADAVHAEADALFAKGDYDAALSKYSWLLHAVEEPQREAIRVGVAECEKQSLAGKQKKYSDAMTRAKACETSAKFKEAEAFYTVALDAKPGDAEALVQQQKNRDMWYKVYTKRADSADGKRNYILAQAFLEEARIADPKSFKQGYDKKFVRIANDAAGQRYEDQKKKGNEAFDIHDWTAAKQAYDSALAVNKDDDYCGKRLIKIKEAVEKERDDEKKEAEYYALLSSAKGFAAAKELDAAIAKYDAAMKLFPDRRFAKEKREALTKLKTNASAKR